MQTATLLRYDVEDDYDDASTRILLCGKAFQADPTGALYWPAEDALIVADLQLSKCSYLDDDDVLLPPYDTASAFEKLEEALDRYDPARVVALGNSFAGLMDSALSPHQLDWLLDMMEAREWYWVMSQDANLKPDCIEGIVVPHMMLGGIKFRAEPLRAPVANEIAGGLHPVAQINEFGWAVRGRCFVSNGMRMVLPAMGSYSAGVNVLEEAFDPLLGRSGVFVWLISNDRVYPVASGQLMEDQAAA